VVPLEMEAEEQRYLCLWFAHPAFDRLSVAEVEVVAEGSQAAGGLGRGDLAIARHPAKRADAGPGWITTTLPVGTFTRRPARAEVRLRYSVGEWRFWEELPVEASGRRSLASGVSVGPPGEGADGRTFVELVRAGDVDEGIEQFDFVALTKAGGRLERNGHGRTGQGGTRVERFMFDARLAQVRAFEVRKRPVRSMTWDVSLRRERIVGEERAVRFDRAGDTMQAIVQRLRRELGLRVAFEDLDFAPEDGITLGHRLAELGAREAAGTLTPRERDLLMDARRLQSEAVPQLESADRIIAEETADHTRPYAVVAEAIRARMNPGARSETMVDVGQRFTYTISTDTVREFFEPLLHDTPYRARKVGGTWLIEPRAGSRLAYPVTLDCAGLSVDEAVAAILAQAPGERPFGRGLVFIGPVAPGMDGTPWLGVRAPPLKLAGVTAAEALCRVTGGAAPASVWELAGYRESRMLGLAPEPGGEALPVVQTGQVWLRGVDVGDYAASWRSAAGLFRAALTEDKWVEALEAVRRPLGEVRTRRLRATRDVPLPAAPEGRALVLEFASDFAGRASATETLTLVHEDDGEWRVAGYFIR
jgi:Protein of unknown function (DUF4019)